MAEALARSALEVEALKEGAGAQALEAAAAAARRGDEGWLDDNDVGLPAGGGGGIGGGGGGGGGGGVRRRWSSVLQERVKEHDEIYFRTCTLRANSRVVSDAFRGVGRPELKRMVATFRAFDTNDNGSLDAQEFLKFLEERDIFHPSKVVLEALFTKTDLDGDGQIDVNEWLLYGVRREKSAGQVALSLSLSLSLSLLLTPTLTLTLTLTLTGQGERAAEGEDYGGGHGEGDDATAAGLVPTSGGRRRGGAADARIHGYK